MAGTWKWPFPKKGFSFSRGLFSGSILVFWGCTFDPFWLLTTLPTTRLASSNCTKVFMPRMRTLTNRNQFCHGRNSINWRILWLPSGNKNQPGTLNKPIFMIDIFGESFSCQDLEWYPTETPGFFGGFVRFVNHPKTSIFWRQKTYLKHWTWVGFWSVLGWKQESGVQFIIDTNYRWCFHVF